MNPTATLGPDSRLEVATRVRFREIGGEAVLLDLEAGTYFGLNATGTVAWRCLERGATLGEAQAALTARFSVDPDRAWADLVELVSDLLDRDLVVVKPAVAVTV